MDLHDINGFGSADGPGSLDNSLDLPLALGHAVLPESSPTTPMAATNGYRRHASTHDPPDADNDDQADDEAAPDLDVGGVTNSTLQVPLRKLASATGAQGSQSSLYGFDGASGQNSPRCVTPGTPAQRHSLTEEGILGWAEHGRLSASPRAMSPLSPPTANHTRPPTNKSPSSASVYGFVCWGGGGI